MPSLFPTRTHDFSRLNPIAAMLVAAGMALAAPAHAMDDGSGSMDEPKKDAAPASSEPAAKMEKAAATKPAAGAAKDAAKATEGPSSAELLNDFVHYVLIDRPDLAKSMGQTLLDRKLPAAEFVKLVDQGTGYKRFEQAVLRGQRRADLEEVSAGLLRAYEGGRLATVRNPEAVTANIKMLTGTMRERDYARTRLISAGEYAMPQLFTALLDRTQPATAAEVRQVMVEMGKHAVMPLCSALPRLGATEQEAVLNVLADIPYTASVPFIYEVINAPGSPQTKAVAEEAVRRIVGAVSTQVPQADRFNTLANEYYSGSPGLINFPGEANQLVWSYEPQIGLVPMAVDSRLYPSAMAMRLSEEALKRDPKHAGALSTWLASNFKRELNTPEGYENPTYPKDRRDAMYYAVAAGSTPVQAVLARALDANDTPLARRAIAALERTAGGATLWKNTGPRLPLLEALRYPNRRVQYDAALALAAAGPREAFGGSDQVVRILASAVRDSGAKYALVLASESERQSSLTDLLRAQGFTTLSPGVRLDEVRQSIADAPGVDLIVTDLPSESTVAAITDATNDAKLKAAPIIALASAQSAAELSTRFGGDARVRIARQGMTPKEIAAAANQMVAAVGGADLKGDESNMYRDRALSTLRDLGISASPVFNVADAQAPLVTAMDKAKGATRMRIADVLALANSKQAQQALVDAALAASGDERVGLLIHAATSAKRAGNLLDETQVQRIVDLAKTGEGAEATAAAALVGALNLSGGEVVPLILGTK